MKELTKIVNAQATHDGDGVKIHRLAGPRLHAVMNPFLMIDEINSDDAADYIGGFPEHPHRGFETITYMKAGLMRHRDHMGHEGVIGAGDVQWMSAAAGILHSEMPEQKEGLLHGFQIWLNLPSSEKMKPAAYNEILSKNIPEQPLSQGGVLRAIAGRVRVDGHLLNGPLPEASTEPVFLDLTLAPNETVELDIQSENPAMTYVYSGATTSIGSRTLGVYEGTGAISLTAGPKGAQLLLLSGRALDEPVVQYGPFVMNSEEEINQAMRDFRDPAFLKSLTPNL